MSSTVPRRCSQSVYFGLARYEFKNAWAWHVGAKPQQRTLHIQLKYTAERQSERYELTYKLGNHKETANMRFGLAIT